MKIRILMKIPVRGANLVAGDICEVIRKEPFVYNVRDSGGYWVMGMDNQEVKILPEECEVLEDEEKK